MFSLIFKYDFTPRVEDAEKQHILSAHTHTHTAQAVLKIFADADDSEAKVTSRQGRPRQSRRDPVASHDSIMRDMDQLEFSGSDMENIGRRKRVSCDMFAGDGEEDEEEEHPALGTTTDGPPPPPTPPPAPTPPPPAPTPRSTAASSSGGPRPDNSFMISGQGFVKLREGRPPVYTGISRMCRTCGYERNLYHIASGLTDETAARRLLNWEKICPGRHESKAHKDLGQPKVSGRLMVKYDR